MKKHRNIPIFIPHLGCPNQCVFCNQHAISGCREFSKEDVKFQIDEALYTIEEGTQTEIAFFGGSFTGIDRHLMVELLELAQGYVRLGRVQSIRLSTRPDYISDEILELLSHYSVQTIELGLQSMEDSVLQASQRGHTAAVAQYACRAVVNAGFSLVGQMMIGLPNSTVAEEERTARCICELGATAVRIYPTVVFYDTPLCQMAQNGEYVPLSLQEAVERSARVLQIFRESKIPCIRLGLCACENLASDKSVFGGPNHPALGELVLNECYYLQLQKLILERNLIGKEIVLSVPKRELSQAVGQNKRNIRRLLEEHGTKICQIIGNDSGLFTAWQR